MFERDGNMCKNKNGKQQNGMNSSNGCEFENVIQAFGRNAGILDELSDRSSQVIVDVLDQEEITHEEVEKRCKEICEAEYFHLKNAPIRVEDLPPKISIEDFRQKLYELQSAKVEEKKREEIVKEEIAKKKEQISEIEEIIRKKLEVINAAKRLLN